MDQKGIVSFKNTVIGITVLIVGFIQTFGIITLGVIYLPYTNSWYTSYPSKLLSVIFAGSPKSEAEGLGLGGLLVVGIFLELLGFALLTREYLKR